MIHDIDRQDEVVRYQRDQKRWMNMPPLERWVICPVHGSYFDKSLNIINGLFGFDMDRQDNVTDYELAFVRVQQKQCICRRSKVTDMRDKQLIEFESYEEVGQTDGLVGYRLKLFVTYMERRWPLNENFITREYADEWALRFKQNREFAASDGTGKSILRELTMELDVPVFDEEGNELPRNVNLS